MGINRATEYSIRALVYMAMNPNVEVVSKVELCNTQGVSPGFLTKVMQPLIKAGVVKSYRGVKGGFQLARDPKDITIYEILEHIDNVTVFNQCLTEDGACSRDNTCFMHTIWEESMESAKNILRKYTLAEVARQQVRLLSLIANGTTSR